MPDQKQLPSSDPFDDTKMSFGQHLEELRTALIRSILAVLAGFCIGLLIGGDMVRYVQEPLITGLEELRMKQKLRRHEARDQAKPADWTEDERYVPEDFYVDPQKLVDLLKKEGISLAEPEAQLPERIPLTLWRSIEDDPGVRTIGTGVPDAFTVYVKASLVVGILIASPFVFYFLWNFVASGLYPNEKKQVHIFMPMSIGLFLLGAALAFFVVFQFVLAFLFQFYDWMDIDPTPRISEWLSFVLILPVGFGLAFQLPLVMLFLERVGILTVEIYFKYWRYAILVIALLSMFLTPADPQSMIAMGLPLIFLYFGGALLCKYLPKNKSGEN